MTFDNYRFRCSSLPTLMTSSRSKSDPLSQTAKAYLLDVYISEVYGRDKDTSSKYTEKGIEVESDSLDLVSRATGEIYFKNQKRFNNDYISGTPDVVDNLIDIKSSWSIHTFAAVDAKKARGDYYWQLLGYMWLLNQDKGRLIYALTDTPDRIMYDELYRMSFKDGRIDTDEEYTNKIKLNYKFADIPDSKRVKIYTFERNEEDIELLKTRIEYARDYLNGLDPMKGGEEN